MKAQVQVFALLLLMFTRSAWSQDAATAAGVAAGTAVFVSYGIPLLTRSEVTVKIDKFIKEPLEGVDSEERLSFPLSHTPVIVRPSEFTAGEAYQVYTYFGGTSFRGDGATPLVPNAFKETRTALANTEEPIFVQLRSQLEKLIQTEQSVLVRAADYRSKYEDATRDNKLEERELSQLRSLADGIAVELGSLGDQLFAQKDATALQQFVELAGEQQPALKLEAEAYSRRDLEGSDPKEDAGTLASAAAVQVYTTSATVLQLTNSLTAGLIEGPISREAYQGLVAQGKFIDQVLREEEEGSRWRRYNECAVRGGTGDSDTVIYLENMFTPIIKKSRFSPDAFIAAQGQFYKQALKSVADVYGVPLAGSTPSSLSVIGQQAVQEKTAEETAAARKAQVEAFSKILAGLKVTDGNYAASATALRDHSKKLN